MSPNGEHPSSSAEQRRVEEDILTVLGELLGVSWSSPPIELRPLRLDGFALSEPCVLVEAFAHVGQCKPGQRRKLSRDMTKLLLAEKLLGRPCRKVIAVVDTTVVPKGSWDASFAKEFGINFMVVALPDEVMASLRRIQIRQGR